MLPSDRTMMVVPVDTSDGFSASTPRPLFTVGQSWSDFREYDVRADGQRFLICRFLEVKNPEPLVLLTGRLLSNKDH